MQKLKRRRFLQKMTALLLVRPAYAMTGSPLIPPLTHDASIAFCFNGPNHDKGWTDWHEQAVHNISRHFPDLKFITLENILYSISTTRLLQYLITENVQMIFTNSNYDHFLQNVAKQVPHVSFTEYNGNNIDTNLSWFYPTYWHVFYILGYTAALLSKTGKIGFINAFPIPCNIANINATLLGAQKANPLTQLKVITIGSWFDPKSTLQAAHTLCDDHCDILFNLTNDPSHLTVAEQRHGKAVLYNCPKPDMASSAYISTIYCNFETFYSQQIQERIKGQWTNTPSFLQFPEHCDYLAFGASVPLSIREQTTHFRNQFILNGKQLLGPVYDQNGTLRINAGTAIQNNKIYQWDWFIKDIILM